LFGVESAGREAEIGDAMAVIQAEIAAEFRGITTALPAWVSTPGRRRLRAAVTTIEAEVRRLISKHRADQVERGDVLSQLLAARDEHGRPMTENELRDESVSLYTGGHESTSATLTWVWYLLSRSPAARERLDAELADVLGGRLPVYADLIRLTWTKQLVKEALRLYPAVWVTVTTASADTTLAGLPLLKGTNVWISPFAAHRDPRWFPDPDSFRPERWDREASPSYEAWFPFGKGPRMCLGAQFALTVTTMVIAVLAQRFRLEVRSAEVAPAPRLTLQPSAPIFAELRPAPGNVRARA
jgi:cytochrome P450